MDLGEGYLLAYRELRGVWYTSLLEDMVSEGNSNGLQKS
jgi:hypothetical protein